MPVVTCALGPDSAGTLVTRFIRQARTSLDAALYEVGPAYRWAFRRAVERGVAVRLLLDARAAGNLATAAEVRGAGGECRLLARRAGQAHWKMLAADADRLAVGTGNLIWRDAPRDWRGRVPPESPRLAGTREWWILLAGAPACAQAARDEFARAWLDGVPVELVDPGTAPRRPPPPAIAVGAPDPEVAPLDVAIEAVDCRMVFGGAAAGSAAAQLMDTASQRLLIAAPYVSTGATAVDRLLDRAQAARRRGASVRMLLGAPPRRRDAEALAALGVAVAVMDPSRSTFGHAKGLVADSAVAVTSANWSRTGLGVNREAGLVVSHPDAAGYFADCFARDWAVSIPLRVGRHEPAVSRLSGSGILGSP